MSAHAGQPCEGCGKGRYRTYSTLLVRHMRVRYLHCPQCGFKPQGNKIILPIECSHLKGYSLTEVRRY